MPFRHYQPPLPLPLQPNARSSHPPGPYLYEFNNPPPVTAWYPDSVPMVSDDFVTRLPGFTEEMPSEHRQDYYRYPSRQQGYPPAETYRQPRKTIQRDPNLKRPPAVARVATKPHQHEHPDGGGFGNFPSANTSAARHSAHSGLPLPEVADDVALGNALSRVFGAIPLQVAFIGLGPIAKANRSLKQFKASLKLLFFGNSKLPQYMYIAVLNMKDSLSSQEYIRKQQSRYRLHHPITAQQIIIDQELFSAERSDNSRIFDEEIFARDRWLKIRSRIKGDVKLIFAWFIGVAPIWDILANNEGFEDKIAFIGKALPYFYTARGRLCEETIRIDLPNCMPPSRDEPYTTQMVIYGVNLRRSAAKGGEYGFKDDGRGLQPIEGLRNLQTAYREEDWQAKNLFF